MSAQTDSITIETSLPGERLDTYLRVLLPSIDSISGKRITQMLKMHSDLMRSPRMQDDLD